MPCRRLTSRLAVCSWASPPRHPSPPQPWPPFLFSYEPRSLSLEGLGRWQDSSTYELGAEAAAVGFHTCPALLLGPGPRSCSGAAGGEGRVRWTLLQEGDAGLAVAALLRSDWNSGVPGNHLSTSFPVYQASSEAWLLCLNRGRPCPVPPHRLL